MAHDLFGSLTSPTRSAVVTTRGLVCSASPHAAAVGAKVLREGGNAFDAAIAIAAAEGVTITPMCGIGGEVFALLYEAASGKLYQVSGNGRAPRGASRDFFVRAGHTQMPARGPLSPSVPGEVHAWESVLDRFGTRSLASLIGPAIALAEDGYPLPPRIAENFTLFNDLLTREPTTAAVLTHRGAAMQAGDVLKQPDLARSLRRIAEGGAQEYYKGTLAKELAAAVQAAGGLISEEDLAAHATSIEESPLTTTYRGYTVATNGLPTQGYVLLGMLNILEGFDLAAMGHGTADSVHVMVEAAKLAFADRNAHFGDPDFVSVPMNELLSDQHAARRRKRIDMARAADSVPAEELAGVRAEGDTSYFTVVDEAGNAASFIHSLSNAFGSGLIAGGTGILLNNRTGRSCFLEEGHPNVVAPGKRPVHTIHAYMVLDGGKPVLLGGTPGGDSQAPWNAQVLTGLIDYGLNIQEAAETPRWTHFPGGDQANVASPFELRMEPGFGESIERELAQRGHNLAPIPPTQNLGAVQLIAIDAGTGVRAGATDTRCDGYPVPG